MNCRSKCLDASKCMTISAFIIFMLGIALLFLKTWLLQIIVTSILVLKPDSLIESLWRYIPDLQVDIYIFNWTNPADFRNLSVRPKFEETGPYQFKEDIEKVDVIWNKNKTVTYNQLRHFTFNEDINKKNISTPITIINFISLCISHLVRDMIYPVKKMASAYITTSQPYIYITKSTKELLFEGFDDFLFDMGSYLPFIYPEIPRFEKVSFLNIIAAKSFDKTFNIANGADGAIEIRNWNFNNVTPYFPGSCAEIYGSTGELYSRKLSKDYIDVFLSPICRHTRLDFEEEILVGGIIGYKYSAGDKLLDNGSIIPENKCYCDGECMPSGVINISPCRYGFPVYLSLPNFYGADSAYVNAVEGLHPQKAKHEAYIIIEPNTGIPLQATARVQLNILMQPVEDISMFEDVRKILFPVFWLEERSSLPDHVHLLLKIYLMLPCIITGIGCILVALALVLPFKPKLIAWLKKFRMQKQCILPTPEEIHLRKEG